MITAIPSHFLSLVVIILGIESISSAMPTLEGTWQINPDKSAENIIEAHKLPENRKGDILSELKDMNKNKISISKDTIVIVDIVYPCEIVSQSDSETIFKTIIHDKEIAITVTPYDNESVNMRFSGSEDTAVLVWKKVSDELISGKRTGEMPDVDKDKNGKTPFDYVTDFYATVNDKDLDAFKNLYTQGYYEYIITRGSDTDPVRFKTNQFDGQYESKSVEIYADRSGFRNAKQLGIFTVSIKIHLTDSGSKAYEAKWKHPPHEGAYNTMVHFRLENGVWRVTDSNNGY